MKTDKKLNSLFKWYPSFLGWKMKPFRNLKINWSTNFQLPFAEAAEVCFSRRMELLSLDTVIEQSHKFFTGRIRTRYFESGQSMRTFLQSQNVLFLKWLLGIDQNRIWTSADASCSAQTLRVSRKCSHVRWCATGATSGVISVLPFHVPKKRKHLCLAYERIADRFVYKSCKSHFYFVCEVFLKFR